MRARTLPRMLVTASVLVGAMALAVLVRRDSTPPEDDQIGWTVLFTGYGEVTSDDGVVVLEPRSAASKDDTHAALVRTTQAFVDADFEVTVRTEAQVRRGTPNTWEVGWVLWNFRDNDHFYAVALKPNGWEISKQDPAYPGKQRFLATGEGRVFPVGRDYRVRVEQDWPRMTVSVDGEELTTLVDEEAPYRSGYVGLYTEDARVRFTDLDLLEVTETRAPSTLTPEPWSQ